MSDLILQLLRDLLPDAVRGIVLSVVGVGLVGLSGYLVYDSLRTGTPLNLVLVIGGLLGAALSFCIAFICFVNDRSER